MTIAELTSALKEYVDGSRTRLEEILEEPVRHYLDASMADHAWFAAMMHNTGSEADEALRITRTGSEMDRAELAKAVVQKLSSTIISHTLMPALLPTSLLSSVNQAILSCLRDAADGEMGNE